MKDTPIVLPLRTHYRTKSRLHCQKYICGKDLKATYMTKAIEKYCLHKLYSTFSIQYQATRLLGFAKISIVEPFELCSRLIFGGCNILIAI